MALDEEFARSLQDEAAEVYTAGREPLTWKKYRQKFEEFGRLCDACGLPRRFQYEQLAAWCTLWCRNFSPTSLATHFTAFRAMAVEFELDYLRKHGLVHKKLPSKGGGQGPVINDPTGRH